ncbi:Hypothetical predicted protein [Podarcis lilfordi]|uniref:Uncharacterized protein n=1 Tax=Podarcis lilfordi TaxID=74358 RepID=A0AA35PV49_9SAUR|nr:Hypothetical predicted protein [Podarcis lilfordi]
MQAQDGAAAGVLAAAAKELRRDQRAIAHLVMAIDEAQMVYIDHATYAHEVWGALQRVHQQDMAGARIHVIRQLFDLRLQPGGCVREHISQMLALFNRLRQLQIPFTEQQKVFILLSSLDSSYQTLSHTLEAIPAQELDLEYVSGRLQDEQDKRLREKGRAAKGVALCPGVGVQKMLRARCKLLQRGGATFATQTNICREIASGSSPIATERSKAEHVVGEEAW